ncbi:MFS transporter [Nonomuraea rubra]|uniref:DHA2 family multidrug resistance protein-like MFS transporter n=1 Tax=Nonomuraea rubra TaxID=46180 RepID=A0A7X0NUC9_9ACTN|nr:MFS transporter [Nonomuraea rubra]MBB6549792.1 DHA2 family multidrug resistance protein-like MFS transporter [Nonomuraea rubra]
MTDDGAPRAGRKEWMGLAALALPTMLVSLDISVLFLALPHLSVDLGANATQQLWITDIYGFMTAGFLVTMGSLGDRIGRRRLLLVGGAAFGLVSLVAAMSTSPEMLIVCRALLGIAGATLLPSTLSLIGVMFRDPKQFGQAMAVWGTAFMVGIALGPAVGGALLERFWWGSVFVMGVPVMLLLIAALPLLPEFRDPDGGRLDLLSVVLSLGAILPLIYGLKAVARDGWAAGPLVAIAAGLVVGVVFVRRQRALEHPLFDLRLFRHRAFTAAVLIGMLCGSLQTGTGMEVALFLQTVEGLSPLVAGLWLLIPSLVLIVSINLTPRVAAKVRPAYVLGGGMLIAVLGQLLITQVAVGAVVLLIVFLSVCYFGVGPVGGLVNQVAMASSPPEKAGSAASMVATGGEFGVALGIATLGTLGTAVYRSELVLPAGAPAVAGDSINGAVGAASGLPAAQATELLDAARAAFTTGLNVVGAVNAVLFAGLALLALTQLRHLAPFAGHHHPEPEPQPEQGQEAALAK